MGDDVLEPVETLGCPGMDKIHDAVWAIAAIGLHDRRRRWPPGRLVGREPRFYGRLRCKLQRQVARVEDGLGRAIGTDRDHRMRRVAQERYAALRPPRQ